MEILRGWKSGMKQKGAGFPGKDLPSQVFLLLSNTGLRRLNGRVEAAEHTPREGMNKP